MLSPCFPPRRRAAVQFTRARLTQRLVACTKQGTLVRIRNSFKLAPRLRSRRHDAAPSRRGRRRGKSKTAERAGGGGSGGGGKARSGAGEYGGGGSGGGGDDGDGGSGSSDLLGFDSDGFPMDFGDEDLLDIDDARL